MNLRKVFLRLIGEFPRETLIREMDDGDGAIKYIGRQILDLSFQRE